MMMTLPMTTSRQVALRGRVAPSLAGSRPAPLVVVRAEVKQGREYREDDDTIAGPGQAPRKASDALYADDAPRRQVAKKDNMSKEMKQRLREEYYGLGGAENKVVAPAAVPRRLIVAATTVTTSYEERVQGVTENSEATTSGSAPAPQPKKNASKWVIDENENLKSTPEQRAWTWVSIALIGATFQQALSQVHDPSDAAVFAAVFVAAYLLADFGTGVYHWGVDNYGDANTPVFGRQIAAFQGHHQRPWTITQREFCNNMHQVFGPASYFAAVMFAVSPLMPLSWNAWSSTFLFLVCMSQQFHAWSHMKKSELHPAVVALQDVGLLISRKDHGSHHRAPFDANYCIVSGIWNKPLDQAGFFRAMEHFIHKQTGIEPRSWHEPEHDWRELTREEADAQTAAARAARAAAAAQQ